MLDGVCECRLERLTPEALIGIFAQEVVAFRFKSQAFDVRCYRSPEPFSEPASICAEARLVFGVLRNKRVYLLHRMLWSTLA